MTDIFHLKEVKTRKDIREFHALQNQFYIYDPNWIQPLVNDVEAVFTPSRNTLLRNGEAIRWILVDTNNNPAGRVAAFYSRKIATGKEPPVGGMGFFECVNNYDAALVLFEACRNWLAEKGMKVMEGPVNFGERDRWWGLLADGFLPPNYCMPYNPPYYRNFFEQYGFQNYF